MKVQPRKKFITAIEFLLWWFSLHAHMVGKKYAAHTIANTNNAAISLLLPIASIPRSVAGRPIAAIFSVCFVDNFLLFFIVIF